MLQFLGGALLIFIGVALVIKVIFNIDFPVFKILIAGFFIFLGIWILFGSIGKFQIKSGPNDVLFSERHYHAPYDQPEYNVVFGKGVFDFTDVDISLAQDSSIVDNYFIICTIKIYTAYSLSINKINYFSSFI